MTQKESITQTNPLFYTRLKADFFDSLPTLPEDAESQFSHKCIQGMLSRFFKGKKENKGHYKPGLLAPNENLLIKEIDNYIESSDNATAILTAVQETPNGKTSFLAQAIENNCSDLTTYLTRFHTQEQQNKALVAFVPQQRDFRMGVAICMGGANPNYIPDYARLGLKNTRDTVLFLYLNEDKNKRLPYLNPNEKNPLSYFWKQVDLTHKNATGKSLLTLTCQKGCFDKTYGAPAVLDAVCQMPDKESFDKAMAYEKTYDALIKRIPNDDWDKGFYGGYTTPAKLAFANLTKAFLQTFKKSAETYQEQTQPTTQTQPVQKHPMPAPQKETVEIQDELPFTTEPKETPTKVVSASERKEQTFYQPSLPGMERF